MGTGLSLFRIWSTSVQPVACSTINSTSRRTSEDSMPAAPNSRTMCAWASDSVVKLNVSGVLHQAMLVVQNTGFHHLIDIAFQSLFQAEVLIQPVIGDPIIFEIVRTNFLGSIARFHL